MLYFIIVFAIFYFFTLFIILDRDGYNIKLNAHNVIAFTFILLYVIFFPVCYQLTMNGYNTPSFIEWMKKYTELDIVIYYAFITVVSHVFLFVLRRKNRFIPVYYEDEYSDNKTLYIGIILLIIGLIADYLYLRVYGGYTGYLVYANAVRSGVISVSNPFSFMIAFRDCIVFASYLFFSQIKKNNIFSFGKLFLFLFSAFFALRVLYSNSGRLSILIYFIVILAYALLNKRDIAYVNFKTIVIAIIGGIAFFVALIFIGNMLSRNISNNMTMQITKEISFIYVNFIGVLRNLKFDDWRFLIDTIIFPIYLLPSSIWKVKMGVSTASTVNTFLVSGTVKGAQGVYGEMPVDFVSLSYMQLGVIGIFILPIVYAFLFSWIYKYSEMIQDRNTRKMLKYYIIIVGGVESVVYADPQHIMSRLFSFVILMILYRASTRVRITIGR